MKIFRQLGIPLLFGTGFNLIRCPFDESYYAFNHLNLGIIELMVAFIVPLSLFLEF